MSTIQDVETKNMISEWVHQYTDELYNYALTRLPGSEAAEDVVQNVFVAACENCDKFKAESSPKTWLFGILKNKIADLHRKKYSDKELFGDIYDSESAGDKYFTADGDWLEDHLPSEWSGDEEDLFESSEFQSVLKYCLDALPGKWNSAIQLKYLDDSDASKICQSLGISRQNYWQVISRAKTQLRGCLSDNWFRKESI